MTHIVKRRGHKEEFDSRKVYASCYAACRNAHLPQGEAEKIAEEVQARIEQWIADKKEVTSQTIFQEVGKAMREQNADAAFMYETHRDLA